MSERAPYSRVYWSVMDDEKFDGIREDVRLFGSWSLMLVVADMAWPAPAYVPPTVAKVAVARLVDAELIDPLPGHRFRVRGLDAERGRRAEAGRVGGLASGRSRTVERPLNDRSPVQRTKTNLDETRRDKDETSTPDPFDDPEHEALVWLAGHGCDIRPGNGYHRKLVTAVEVHGTSALVLMMQRLADAGTKQGDIKGFLFGAIDALDAKGRPKLAAVERADRESEVDAAHQRRLAATQRQLAAYRGEPA